MQAGGQQQPEQQKGRRGAWSALLCYPVGAAAWASSSQACLETAATCTAAAAMPAHVSCPAQEPGSAHLQALHPGLHAHSRHGGFPGVALDGAPEECDLLARCGDRHRRVARYGLVMHGLLHTWHNSLAVKGAIPAAADAGTLRLTQAAVAQQRLAPLHHDKAHYGQAQPLSQHSTQQWQHPHRSSHRCRSAWAGSAPPHASTPH